MISFQADNKNGTEKKLEVVFIVFENALRLEASLIEISAL